jgi:hypothetical protein
MSGRKVIRLVVDEPGEGESGTIYEWQVMEDGEVLATVWREDVARQLAAAPDLLEAAKSLLAVAPEGSILAKTLGVNAGILDGLRAAIQKATGQTGARP